MQKERLDDLDALKAVSILLVIFCHYVLLSEETILGNLVMAAAWGAVPCFMMCSGALLCNSSRFSWKKQFHRILRIYLVMAVWKLIYLAVYWKLLEIHVSKTELISYLFFFSDLEGVNTGILWFMIAYLVVLLVLPMIWPLFHNWDASNKKILAFLTGLCFLGSVWIPSTGWLLQELTNAWQISLPGISGLNKILPFSNYANMIFYFLLGGLLFHLRGKLELFSHKWVFLVLILAGTLGLVFIKYLDTGTWRWNQLYLENGYNHLCTVLLSTGLYLFFSACHFPRIYHALGSLIGKYTMGIYYSHYLLLGVCSIYLYPSLQNCHSFLANGIKTAVVCGICVIFTVLLRKIPLLKALVT